MSLRVKIGVGVPGLLNYASGTQHATDNRRRFGFEVHKAHPSEVIEQIDTIGSVLGSKTQFDICSTEVRSCFPVGSPKIE